MKAFAIHQIQRGKTADPRVIPPGGVFEVSGKEESRLTQMGAIRQATKDEITLAAANDGHAQSDQEVAEATAAAAELEAARTRYKELFGKDAAASSKLETLNTKIAEKEAADAAAAGGSGSGSGTGSGTGGSGSGSDLTI